MLQTVQSHFPDLEILLPGGRPRATANDGLILMKYRRCRLVPWLDNKFTLEIHVKRLTGEPEKNMSYIFEEGEDDCTMGNVLSRAKDLYPMPEETRPFLDLCGHVLEAKSAFLQTTVRSYLHWHCRDYNRNTTELQLRATLIFVNKHTALPRHLITWEDRKFTLEIHVERLNGDTTKNMNYIFEEGDEDPWGMKDVLSRAKDLYPGQANARPMLWLCDRVLHDQSDELDWTIRGYLRHCCRDYNEKNAKLQLRATLIFVTDTDPPPRC